MQRPITPALHSALDYASAAVTAAAPRFFDMPRTASRACQAFVATYTPMAALSDTPGAVHRAIPFRTHGAIDKALIVALPALPWMLGFASHRASRNYFLALGAVTLLVTALTDWDAPRREGRAA
ncbi:MAG: hypothetical protein ACM357_00055 [Gemmatimonadota bacterium]